MSKDKSSPNEKFYVLIFGLIFLFLGIFKIIDTNKEFNRYKNSEKLTVVAEIKSVSFVPELPDNPESNMVGHPAYYDCLLEYSVDGFKRENRKKIIVDKNKMLIEQRKSVGDKLKIDIVKDKYGICTLAEEYNPNDQEYFLSIGYVFIGIGFLAFIIFFIAYCCEYFASKKSKKFY